MGGCFAYYTCFGFGGGGGGGCGLIQSKKYGTIHWENLISHYHRAHYKIENIINKYLFNSVKRSSQ